MDHMLFDLLTMEPNKMLVNTLNRNPQKEKNNNGVTKIRFNKYVVKKRTSGVLNYEDLCSKLGSRISISTGAQI